LKIPPCFSSDENLRNLLEWREIEKCGPIPDTAPIFYIVWSTRGKSSKYPLYRHPEATLKDMLEPAKTGKNLYAQGAIETTIHICVIRKIWTPLVEGLLPCKVVLGIFPCDATFETLISNMG